MRMNSPLIRFIAPFVLFLSALAVRDVWDGPNVQTWLYPIQTLLCLGLVIWWWRGYEIQPLRGTLWALGAGVLVFVVWVSPQMLFGMAPRTEGWDPASSPWYWGSLAMRFLRLVVVVALVEEIFWRGFLLRYLVKEDFTKVPFGTFSWLSFIVVSLFFVLEHGRADWPAALVAGIVYNGVAFKTRSLSACVLAHGVTNLLLGGYVLWTRQWGFW